MSTDTNANAALEAILNDEEFVDWWKREGGQTHSLDFMDVAVIRVAYKAYLFGLSRRN